MSRERFYIERRVGPKHYYPLGLQPAQGFGSWREAIGWLRDRGMVQLRLNEGHPEYVGLGGERGLYLRSAGRGVFVPPVAHDVTTKVRTLADFHRAFGYGPPLSIPALEMTEWTWRDELRDVARRVRNRLRRA